MGFLPLIICVTTKARKATKNSWRTRVGRCDATNDPQNVPATMPGAMDRTTPQLTFLLRLWARELEMEVNTMLPIEVPRAMSMMRSCGTPCHLNAKTSIGTMTMPPPTPSSPARTPATAPRTQ